jgi:hypothetical protein
MAVASLDFIADLIKADEDDRRELGPLFDNAYMYEDEMREIVRVMTEFAVSSPKKLCVSTNLVMKWLYRSERDSNRRKHLFELMERFEIPYIVTVEAAGRRGEERTISPRSFLRKCSIFVYYCYCAT